ncbi:hypothetical protein K435DRAFT_425347 [Dendrothele bispora CBS 962.96]|uniref:Uncharacterized protein n=1 Tax=Dendrothele bispora (strain CBS 962.96) TaxID=1314807 RepID=A0A4S8L4R6_DENBC|nr:hypothetical protein K435DRAFT_425347 [Dendrothele bispora CBS 962.96]
MSSHPLSYHLVSPYIKADFNSTIISKETVTTWVQYSLGWLQLSVAFILVATVAVFVKNKVQQIWITCLFFSRAYDLITSKLRVSSSNAFSFLVFDLPITAVKGKAARKSFFEDRNLSNAEGYRIFGGPNAISKVDENHVHPDKDEHLTRFMLRITDLVQRDRYTDAMPALFDAVGDLMATWGNQGIMDPFQNIYDVSLYYPSIPPPK